VTVTVIPTNNAYSYDLNGNLLGDGTRNFAYDDENQLIAVWQANAWSNSFAYDGKLRRRIERDSYWNAGTSGWILTNEIHFVYDGNLVVQERNAANLPQVTYTRGNDLSGSLQGAGGIGGLLARTDNTKLMAGDPLASAYYHCDGNGNVTCLVSPYQEIAAKYLYDPFGNTLAMYGTLATANTYRFSSKEWNGNSGLYYYLYRFYDPNLQRWLNRDPLADEMSLKVRYFGPNPNSLYLNYLGNPYEFDFNNPEMYGDPDGEFAIVLTPIAIGTIVAVGVTAACLASPPCRHALFNLLNQVGKTAHCSAALTACLNDPWIKCPTSKSGYQKKDCRSCYNECLNDGAWPYYKCP
jgi:RHS repeat-associated protein